MIGIHSRLFLATLLLIKPPPVLKVAPLNPQKASLYFEHPIVGVVFIFHTTIISELKRVYQLLWSAMAYQRILAG